MWAKVTLQTMSRTTGKPMIVGRIAMTGWNCCDEANVCVSFLSVHEVKVQQSWQSGDAPTRIVGDS